MTVPTKIYGHTLNSKIDDNSRAIREELNTAVKKISQKMDEMSKKYTKEVDQTTRGEVPNDETMEELSLQPEDEVKQTENEGLEPDNLRMNENQMEVEELEAEDKEDSKALVLEDTHHKNEENIQHQEAVIKNAKNKIIKKTGEKEKKIKGIIRPKKPRITREILEMTRSGLINFVDNPIIRRRTRTNGRKNEQNFIKILNINHHKTVSKNFNKNTVKLKIPTNKIHPTRSIDSSMNNRPLNLSLIHI